jgi:hypothetical protein
MNPQPYTVFMLLQATPRWLGLDADERASLQDSALVHVYERFPAVRLRFFDASAFHGRCTALMVWETTDMPEYRAAVESLRNHPLLQGPNFEVLDVIPSVPDGGRQAITSRLVAWA